MLFPVDFITLFNFSLDFIVSESYPCIFANVDFVYASSTNTTSNNFKSSK